MDLRTEIAEDLLRIKAVQIRTNMAEYFTWTSGIKSPIYCDNRITMSYPEVREKITHAFVQMINEMEEKPDVIAGCATAGIPHAAWIAQELGLPMVYVRSKPKGHGKGNQIEGIMELGKKAVVIEDLISTGGSSIEAVNALRNAGAEITAVLAIFTYGLNKADIAFKEAELDYETITDFERLLMILEDRNQINQSEAEKLLYWRNQL